MKKFLRISIVALLVFATVLGTLVIAGATTYNEGDVILDETTLASLAGTEGDTNAIFGENTVMMWDGEKLVYTPSSSSRLQFATFPTEQELSGGYTISVDVAMAKAPTSDSWKMAQLGIGANTKWAEGTYLEFKMQGTSSETETTVGASATTYFTNKGTDGSTKHNKGINYGDGSYAWGTYVNLKIKVGTEKVKIYVDNYLQHEFNSTDLKNEFGAPWVGGRGGCTIYYDNFTIVAGTPADANESSATTTQRPVADTLYYPGGTIILSEDMIKNDVSNSIKSANVLAGADTYSWNTDTDRLKIKADGGLVSVITKFPEGLDNYTITADLYLTENNFSGEPIFGLGINAAQNQGWSTGTYMEARVFNTGAKPTVTLQNRDADAVGLNGSGIRISLENDILVGVTKTSFKICVAPDVVSFYVEDNFVGLIIKSDLAFKSGLPFFVLREKCTLEIDNLLVYSGSEIGREPDFSKVIGEVDPIDAPDVMTTVASSTDVPTTTTTTVADTTTEAQAATDAVAETTAEEAKKGCKGTLSVGIAMSSGFALAAAFVSTKRRRK